MKISLTAVDVHAEGEPGRVITDGMPELPPGTMLEKMQWLEREADHIRLQMLREPRGYPGLCCNAIVPSDDPRADAEKDPEHAQLVELHPPTAPNRPLCCTSVRIAIVVEPTDRLERM